MIHLDLLPEASLFIEPKALLFCDGRIRLKKSWTPGFFKRLGCLLSGQQAFRPLAVNTGQTQARLTLYTGLGQHQEQIEKAFFWNTQAFVCATQPYTPFLRRRLPSGAFFGLDKGLGGTVTLGAPGSIVSVVIAPSEALYVNPQCLVAAQQALCFKVHRTSTALLQVQGPNVLLLSAQPWPIPRTALGPKNTRKAW